MKRVVALAGLALAAATCVVLAQTWRENREYRSLLSAGEAALAAGQSYRAIEAFSGALALRPDSMAAFYHRGLAYRDQHRDDEAIRDLRNARRLAPDAPEPLVALGQFYDARGEAAQAAQWYGQAVDRLQDADPALLYSLALARYRSGQPAAARAPLRRAVARNQRMADAQYLLGLANRDAQNPDLALDALQQAVRLAPTMAAAREELADLYQALGRRDEALAELQALAVLDARPERQLALAKGQSAAGRFDDALVLLTSESTRSPNDSRVWLAIGRLWLSKAEAGHDRSAIVKASSALERALGGTARRSEGLALFGRALYLSNDLAGAERLLQDAVATSPVDPEAFAFLADAAERLSHFATARDALLSLDALEGDTIAPAARALRDRRIGSLSLDAGDARAAITHVTRAMGAGVVDPSTWGLLARAKWQTGDVEGAKAALGQALALDGQDAGLQRLRRTIR